MTETRHAHQGLPEFHLHGVSQQQSRDKVVRTARRGALAVVVMLLAGLGVALVVRHVDAGALAARAAASAVLPVRVVSPTVGGHEAKLTLPGTLQGIYEAQIYARTNGYVRQWFKDIGQSVKKGDLLATLEIPEIDKQVEEAHANFELAKTAFERWSRLRERDAVSQQEYDERAAAYHQTEAVLKRLRDEQGFGNVVAPFDGIVTRRNVDNGSLVNAGNGGSGQAMFATAQIDRLHVYVYVPQSRAAHIHVGDGVDIMRAEAADKPTKGQIARTAGAIDPMTRTLQVEITVPNADRALLPGAYVDVALTLKGGGMTLPTTALLFGAAGSRVAVVQPDGKVRLLAVTLGTDYGHDVEIAGGLKPDDKVIANPPDSIADGQAVVVVENGKGS